MGLRPAHYAPRGPSESRLSRVVCSDGKGWPRQSRRTAIPDSSSSRDSARCEAKSAFADGLFHLGSHPGFGADPALLSLINAGFRLHAPRDHVLRFGYGLMHRFGLTLIASVTPDLLFAAMPPFLESSPMCAPSFRSTTDSLSSPDVSRDRAPCSHSRSTKARG